jgi:predicted enzyme related to lactoylglutathione lyase
MKRMHVHVGVEDLDRAIGFYSALFATQPAVLKPDYAKWMLDDPRVNFAISTRGKHPGLDHLGIQVESQDELQEVYARLHKAGGNIIDQGQTSCCYAKSEKSWIDDPAGISWETFFTTGAIRHRQKPSTIRRTGKSHGGFPSRPAAPWSLGAWRQSRMNADRALRRRNRISDRNVG